MVNCEVRNYGPCLLVTFPDGRTLLLQSEDDQKSFMENSGFKFGDDPINVDQCWEDYLDIAA